VVTLTTSAFTQPLIIYTQAEPGTLLNDPDGKGVGSGKEENIIPKYYPPGLGSWGSSHEHNGLSQKPCFQPMQFKIVHFFRPPLVPR
jgi:hypothetical protein